MLSPYRAEPYPQGDGSPFQWENCVLAVGTELMDRASVGKWRVPASRLRILSGDTRGGLDYQQLCDVVARATKGEVKLTIITKASRKTAKAIIKSGKAAAFSIDCSVTVKTKRATNKFTGNHTIGVFDFERWTKNSKCRCEKETTEPHGEFLVEDPGTTFVGYRWWSADLLFRAAEARTKVNGKTQGITLCHTRDTEGVTRYAAGVGNVRKTSSTKSLDVGNTKADAPYTVIRTVKGEDWEYDGHSGNGWHEIEWKTGTAFVAGGLLK